MGTKKENLYSLTLLFTRAQCLLLAYIPLPTVLQYVAYKLILFTKSINCTFAITLHTFCITLIYIEVYCKHFKT